MAILRATVRWLSDVRWALNMVHARRFRRKLGFGGRIRFDDALRPRLNTDGLYGANERPDRVEVISYPDALYHAKNADVIRAMHASQEKR